MNPTSFKQIRGQTRQDWGAEGPLGHGPTCSPAGEGPCGSVERGKPRRGNPSRPGINPLDEAATLIPNLLNSRENQTRVSLHQVLQAGGAKDAFGGAEWMPHTDGHWLKVNVSVRL